MKHDDVLLHVRGAARYVRDIRVPQGTLHAVPVPSPLAHGKIRRLDAAAAAAHPGVVAVLTARDVPGANQIGSIIQDEPLLAADEVDFVGQPVALIVAESAAAARAARALIKLDLEALPPEFDPRQAFARGEIIGPGRTFAMGDVDRAWPLCRVVVSGRADSGGQEHMYLETQTALALPRDDGGLKVYSATQSPTAVQRAIARVLGLAMHQVEVDVPRLGGGFGGKEDQATAWAALAALAAFRLGRPVKLTLSRQEDGRFTGKRHPYSSDYKIGLTEQGEILAYETTFYQNAGASADLSPAILERTLFHATNSYFIPNVRATAASCRTHLPPFTAFRGFGGPQAMFVLEAAITHAAKELGLPTADIQRRNLLRPSDELPYGQRFETDSPVRCWDELDKRHDFASCRARVEAFNRDHALTKKGLAVMPVCFGISFTNTMLNQAASLVHVYTDGSVGVSTAAVEMGQGVHRKIRRVAAHTFGIHLDRVRMESTNTSRVANTSPTAASSGADLNGEATRLACRQILERLKQAIAADRGCPVEHVHVEREEVACAHERLDMSWERLVAWAYARRIPLSAYASYATPGIYFDKTKEKGRPFAYHAVGTALIEATVDGLRGVPRIDSVKIVHDVGRSLDPAVDLGQIEGAVMQGIGWMTSEELVFSPEGKLLTDSLATYKVPDIHDTPEMTVAFLDGPMPPAGIMGSKTVGEPPLMYGIGAYYAILEALRAFRPEMPLAFKAPLTAERTFMALWPEAFAGDGD
ncbi:MAG: molybdopterin-dependent oxidoreductase [Candidatus Aminicenantes bacterium]|nr:molybdopterin-dependent oxidoreductase [Candidatus Aminicenantes bacterium]